MATKYTYFDEGTYRAFLERCEFNEEQIDFLVDQRDSFETTKRQTDTETCPTCGNRKEVNYFDYDGYEREMWYTMNRSGLFEDTEDNKSKITNWNPTHTRTYITETNY